MNYGKYSFIRNKQPYYDNRALGFSEFTTMRGYEYYLVDGLDLAMLQTTARLLLFQGVNNYGKLVFLSAIEPASIIPGGYIFLRVGLSHRGRPIKTYKLER